MWSILDRPWCLNEAGRGGTVLSAGLGPLGTDFRSILALILEDLTFTALDFISGPCAPVAPCGMVIRHSRRCGCFGIVRIRVCHLPFSFCSGFGLGSGFAGGGGCAAAAAAAAAVGSGFTAATAAAAGGGGGGGGSGFTAAGFTS